MTRCYATIGAMYDLRKTAEAAAVLLDRAPGHELGRLKLMKLLYLADREAFGRLGKTISGDHLMSLPKGPILSITQNVLRSGDSAREEFLGWVEPRGANHHRLPGGVNVEEDVESLSDAEIDVLRDVWSQYGHLSGPQLVDWTHDAANCPEWHDPGISSRDIEFEEFALAAGYSQDQLPALVEAHRDRVDIARAFASH